MCRPPTSTSGPSTDTVANESGWLSRSAHGYLAPPDHVADFAIHNEVNHNVWFDIGCGSGTACNLNAWIDEYSANYTAAYDQIKSQQSEAKVLVPFTGHFDTSYDQPTEQFPSISIKTFVTRLAQNAGNREWKIALHPYPKDMTSPAFEVSDLPSATFGNLGILPGYLRATFPTRPHAWEVLMTEQGVSSGALNSNEAAQSSTICDAYRNALGTPGISTFIYFRMMDSPVPPVPPPVPAALPESSPPHVSPSPGPAWTSSVFSPHEQTNRTATVSPYAMS
jgi:Family of unknown function (DUF5722)